MLPFGLFVASALGLVFAECARRQLARTDQRVARELAAVISYIVMMVLPVSIYLYAAYRDWYWLFMVESRKVPTGLGVLLVLLPGGAMIGSFLGAGALLRLRKQRLLLYIEIAHALFLLVGVITLHGRLLYNGSTLSFRSGAEVEGRLGWAIGLVLLGLGAGAALVSHALVDEGRRTRPYGQG